MHDIELWHARFGHANYDSLLLLQHHGMVEQMPKVEKPPRHVCEGCVLEKMHMYAFPKDGSVRAVRKLQLVHNKMCGPP
eukprot:c5267_g1_i1 orf=81-317(+)